MSMDIMPCRWAPLQDTRLVDLPPVEQVSRGQELLDMLHTNTAAPLPRRSGSGHSSAKASHSTRATRPTELAPLAEENSDEVRMVVKRTFIEFVATPMHRPSRQRALSDSALTRSSSDEYRPKPAVLPDVLSEMSEVSTDAPSDHEEPGQWGGEANVGCWGERSEAFGMACIEDAAPMGEALPATCMAPMLSTGTSTMSGDMSDMSSMWVQTAFDESGYYQFPMDPMMPWQWAYVNPYSGEFEGYDGLHASPSAASSSSLGAEAAAAGVALEESAGPKTTVLLRNLPTDFSRATLLELLEDEGFDGTFDFIYLPMDFGAKVCLGYAFVNFVSGSDAQRCWDIFSGYSDWESDKVCEVTWGEPCQGLQAHVDRYRNSPVMHKSIPEEWKPLIFKDGVRMPFPAPTKSISAPKLRRRAGRDEQSQAA